MRSLTRIDRTAGCGRLKRGVAEPEHGLLRLQRTVGNRAVQRLLARDVGDSPQPAVTILSPQQVATAQNFYTAQPAKYTPGIIKQIQAEAGVTETGRMSAADVQSVAALQEKLNTTMKPPLKVDGMAGPRTLPRVFNFGLTEEKSIDTYSKKAKAIWAGVKPGADKAEAEREACRQLVAEVNKSLAGQKVPPVTVAFPKDDTSRGVMKPDTWELLLGDSQFTNPDRRNLKATTATVYHEARHAEQFFNVARFLAGRKRSAAQIHAETGIKQDIADKAFADPLKPGSMQALIAQGWHESLFTAAGQDKIIASNARLDKSLKARDAARKAFKADPSEANRLAKAGAEAEHEAATAEHDELVHESDTERVESAVEDQVGDL